MTRIVQGHNELLTSFDLTANFDIDIQKNIPSQQVTFGLFFFKNFSAISANEKIFD